MGSIDFPEEGGFSLIEVLVVLGIVAATALISFETFRSRGSGPSPDTLAVGTVQLAQLARFQALNRHQQARLTINIPARTISINDQDRLIRIPKELAFEVVTGKLLTQEQNQASFIFFPDGSSSGGAITFTAGNGAEVSVRIPWLTGVPSITLRGEYEH